VRSFLSGRRPAADVEMHSDKRELDYTPSPKPKRPGVSFKLRPPSSISNSERSQVPSCKSTASRGAAAANTNQSLGPSVDNAI
jgi:hypothetical protein